MAEIWSHPYYGPGKPVVSDRPTMQRATGGVRLELTGRDAVWVIELTRHEVQRIIDLCACT